MDVFMTIRRIQNDTMVAICDSELIGKTFREGHLCLEVNKKFYGSQLVSLEEGIKGIKQGNNINLVGDKIISEAVNRGILPEGAVIRIAGIPHAIIII